jgi:hypothetical protein
VKARLLRAIAFGLAVGAIAWLIDRSGIALPLALTLACFMVVFNCLTPSIGVRAIDAIARLVRSWLWRGRQGRHHSVGGVMLDVRDDGRQVWIAGADLQRCLGTRDPEDVLAARHAGRWRRDDDGVLLLRADAVVDHLTHCPARYEPRTIRLRRYLEREVLFPASKRKQQSEKMRRW